MVREDGGDIEKISKRYRKDIEKIYFNSREENKEAKNYEGDH